MVRKTKAQLTALLEAANIEIPPYPTRAQLIALFAENDLPDPENEAEPSDDDENHSDGENSEQPIDGDEHNLSDDDEIDRLQRRRQLLQLRAEVRALEQQHGAMPRRARYEFSDVDHAIADFTSDDSYDIRKWIADFEDITGTLNLEDRDRYVCARRKMSGTAKVFLRTTVANDWDSLREALLTEFDRRMSRQDVYDQLRQRNKKKDESCTHYVLCMQEIASHSDIDEGDLIELIIGGLQDRSSDVAMLFAAITIAELKRMLIRYEKLKLRRVESSASRITASGNASTSASTYGKTASGAAADGPRCFNCSAFGHISSACPKEKRVPGSCFRCGEMGHKYQDCPKAPKKQRVAVVGNADTNDHDDDNEELEQAMSALQMVSVVFTSGDLKCTSVIGYNSLLDTGSPVSFITRSLLPDFISVGQPKPSNLCGLGKANISTYGELSVGVLLRNQIRMISVLILADDALPFPMLLGRDALQLFNIRLYSRPIVPISESNSVIKDAELAEQENMCICDLSPTSELTQLNNIYV